MTGHCERFERKFSEKMSGRRRAASRFADWVETLSLIIVAGALAGFGLILAALLVSGLTAAHASEVLQHIARAQGL